jgi:anti-sigma factor RsiW
MIGDELERLAWENIDGTISAGDRTRLEEDLARNDEARSRYVELERMAAMLGRLEPMKPPAELRPRIDRALSVVSPRWRRRQSPANAWTGRLAYLAAGLVLGLVAARVLLPTAGLDRADVVGAMAASKAAVTVELDGVGQLAVWRDGSSRIILELGLSRAIPVELEVGAANGGLTIDRAVLGGAGEAATGPTGVRLSVEGPGRSSILLESDAELAELAVRVRSGGHLLADRLVTADELGGGF